MPLADVLSALRVVILDEFGSLPPDKSARLNFFKSKISGLTTEEAEDLANIPPERFEIYTSTIFSGNRSVLKSHFPLCFALISSVWKDIEGTDFDSFELVKKIHVVKPWTTNTTVGLVTNFVDYLESSPTLTSRIPFLNEIAKLELETLYLKRDNYETSNNLALANELTLSVAELSETPFTLTPLARLNIFEFDVISYRTEFYELGKNLPATPPAKTRTYAIGGRTRELYTRWNELKPATFELLSAITPGDLHPLSELAEAIINDSKENDEQKQFKEFFAIAKSLEASSGISILIPV